MSRVSPRRTPLLALTVLGIGAALAPASPAFAESARVLQLAKGIGGPQKEKGGAGHEQPSSVVVQKNKKTYVVTVYMSSNVDQGDRPWQCKCTSVELDPMLGPSIVADQVQLTDYDGDRPCNHPAASTDGAHVVWTFGSDMNNQANVSTYAGVLDEMCKVEADPIRISKNNNNNEGAPDVQYNGNGQFTAGYLSTNNDDTSFARGLTLHDTNGTISLEKSYLSGVVTPSNIGRPAIMAAGPDRSFFCAAKGDNRPPEDGVECAWIDAISGKVIWKQILAASDPANKIYMNQPSVAALEYGRFAVNVQESSGAGKKNNIKGANKSHLYVVEPTDAGMTQVAMKSALGSYQTHAAICSGKYGMEGKRTVGIFGAPITGVGLPGLQMVNYDTTTSLVADPNGKWAIGYYGDSGYIANIYGQNPKQQGRDFLRCIGDVPNPGHGVSGGFMSNVETFFVAPHAGRIPGDPKNALFLSLVPGKTDKPVVPEPPAEVTASPTGSTGAGGSDPGTGAGGSIDPTTGAGGSTGSNGEEPTGTFPSSQPSGCACAVPGASESSTSGGLAGLAILGLALAVVSRRKES